MKKLSVDIAPNVGALLLLVSVVGMVLSLFAGGVVGPIASSGMTLGIILLGWGAFSNFNAQGDSGMPLSEAVERIRVARLS
ncbi:hypothetical protein [Kocuria sp. CPCC 205263]|uniref:hypothetical protein n=1 Tax=Kocuria sp. CPCC 205263 TaxID=3073555 RepID=UPI0034D775B3